MMSARVLSPEEIALSEARKLRRLKQATERTAPLTASPNDAIKQRSWLSNSSSPIQNAKDHNMRQVKVLTWNMLAQCLVRRELFPTSNCLKAGQREGMLHFEVLSQDADILCLQEVDRLEKLLPKLTEAGYGHTFASGPGKKHGCLIAFKTNLYKLNDSRVVNYDDQHIRDDGSEISRRGGSFRTRNIGFLVSLSHLDDESQGVIVATTHLFWHPRYTYERARQAGILVREVLRYRADLQSDNWPCILAGDFNCPPNDATYSLIVGDPLLPDQEQLVNDSRVVHVSIDPCISSNSTPNIDDADGEEAADPDRTITHARPAKPSDGLLTVQELVGLHNRNCRILSAYDEGLRDFKKGHTPLDTFGDEASWPAGRHGCFEPRYTSYTHYWKTVLDYIFVVDPPCRVSTVSGLLSPHKTADLLPGLPQKGVSASDHMSLVAEIAWTDKL